ncbi:hypothetical protein RQP46_001920 [Phenoliferia psychrophenolica]
MEAQTRGASLLATFGSFRSEIDAHYDRRERCIKISRDITALSKKAIFTLHRISTGDKAAIFREAEKKFDELRVLFAKLAVEVHGEDFWRYEKSVSPGIQEFLEAYTFYHYLQHSTLPSLSACQTALDPSPSALAPPPSTSDDPALPPPPPPSSILITAEDYLGGIADLTGELMRLAIARVGSSLGSEQGMAEIRTLGKFVRDIKGEMDPLAPYARWLNKKLTVLDQSLGKIEAASYTLQIRGAEFVDSSPAMLDLLSKGPSFEVEVA